MYNGEEVHLQNCSGLDIFKGLNIIIAGKYDKPEASYEEYALERGITNLHRSKHAFCYNGLRQMLYTFDDERLRMYQLDYINYITEQAYGRGRPLRMANEVHIFSDFITRGVDYYVD